MQRLIRVRTPEFIREINVAGHVLRGQIDEQGPYIDIDADQESSIRQILTAAPAGESSPENPGTAVEEFGDQRTHHLNVADAATLIAGISDLDELKRIGLGEMAHPNFPGGRRGVLTYLDQHMTAVEASDRGERG